MPAQPITVWRRITQFAFFALTGEWLWIGWVRCPYGIPFVSCPSCPLGDCPGRRLAYPFLGLLGVSAVLFGRGFCGWACPMGLVMDALGRLPKPKAVLQAGFARVDRVLKWLKWAAVAALFVFVVPINYPVERAYAYVVRTPSAFNLGAVDVARGLGSHIYLVRVAILVTVLVVGLVVSRVWCRYLCPLGGILSLFNKFSLFRIHKDAAACNNCGKYPRECIQYTCPETSDCVMCGECAQGCGQGAISLGPCFRSLPAGLRGTPEAQAAPPPGP